MKVLFVLILGLLGTYWDEFQKIPSTFYSWTACVWAMGVYRPLNKGQTSLPNEFFFSFYIRMIWGVTFAYLTTGTIIPNTHAFIITAVETYITTMIFTAMPLDTFNWFWNNRLFRFCIFIMDQITGGGLIVDAIFKKFVVQDGMLGYALGICIIKGTCRPVMQILTGIWNGNNN